jgi:hypothetical protein
MLLRAWARQWSLALPFFRDFTDQCRVKGDRRNCMSLSIAQDSTTVSQINNPPWSFRDIRQRINIFIGPASGRRFFLLRPVISFPNPSIIVSPPPHACRLPRSRHPTSSTPILVCTIFRPITFALSSPTFVRLSRERRSAPSFSIA